MPTYTLPRPTISRNIPGNISLIGFILALVLTFVIYSSMMLEVRSIALVMKKVEHLIYSSHGASRQGMLVFVLFLICGIYFGSQVISYYYSYFEMQGQMEAQGEKAQVHSNDQIRNYLWRDVVRKLEIPLESRDDILIERSGRQITISTYWEEPLYIELLDFYYELYVFKFEPRVVVNF